MDKKEQEYIDKKFNDMYSKLSQPDPALLQQHRTRIQKMLIPWIVAAFVIVGAAMVLSFYFVGIL